MEKVSEARVAISREAGDSKCDETFFLLLFCIRAERE